MTEKTKGSAAAEPGAAEAKAEQAVYVRNHLRSAIVVAPHILLAPERVTAVPAALWEKFKATEFAADLLADEAFEETTADDLAGQRKTPVEEADEADAAVEADARARRKRGRK